MSDDRLYMSSFLLTDDFVSVRLRSDDDSSILPDPFDIHIHIPKERKIHIKLPEIATEAEDSKISASTIESTPPPTTIPPLSTTSASTSCRTVSGPDSGQSCVLPFRFKGVLFNGCTFVGSSPGETEPWCSTLKNSNNDHVGGQGNWGFCASDCPIIEFL